MIVAFEGYYLPVQKWKEKKLYAFQTGTLTYGDLPKLDKRFRHLPAGFTFRTKTLDRDLIIKAVGGKARIMGDELGGSWDALDPGVANYQPERGFSSLVFFPLNTTTYRTTFSRYPLVLWNHKKARGTGMVPG